nr:MAG TPA: hypothetical protein [Caudoviricetes sp.]
MVTFWYTVFVVRILTVLYGIRNAMLGFGYNRMIFK